MLPESFTPQFLKQLELLKLNARRSFLGSRQGGHLSQKRGHGIEFSEYRKYELGDNPRYIDWGVYARSDKIYIKRFQEEQDLSVLILLDPSASMTTPASDKKWGFSVEVACALAYISLLQQDTVTISALGTFNSPTYTGGRAFHRLADDLGALSVGKPLNFAAEMQRAASRSRFPGVAVVISDFLMPVEEIQSAFNALRARNLDITAIQVLGPSDIDPLSAAQKGTVVDSETGEELTLALDARARTEYERIREHHSALLRSYFLSARISFTTVTSNGNLLRFLIDNLSLTGLIQ